jgi:hypothetical protein
MKNDFLEFDLSRINTEGSISSIQISSTAQTIGHFYTTTKAGGKKSTGKRILGDNFD